MKTILILFLSCVSVPAADSDVEVVTTSQTNVEQHLVLTQEVFTRAGQTNLVRHTMWKAGKLQNRMQNIYHGGIRLGLLTTRSDNTYLETMAGSFYSVSFDFWPSNTLLNVVVWTANDTMIDAFTCKDGILTAMKSAEFQLFHRKGTEVHGSHR